MVKEVNGTLQARIFTLDLQGRNGPLEQEAQRTSLWLATIYDGREAKFITDGASLLSCLVSISSPTAEGFSKGKAVCIYVYDLAFVWSFLLPLLDDCGLTYDETTCTESDKGYRAFSDKGGSSVWSVVIKFGKKNGLVLFKDISKMYTGYSGVADLAHDLKIAPCKTAIDPFKERLLNYQPDKNELKTSLYNCKVLFSILKENEDDEKFFQSFTIASYSFKKLIKRAFGWAKNPYMVFRSKKFCPDCEDDKEAYAVGQSIFGGLTGTTFNHFDEDTPLLHLDAVQFYPSTMKKEPLPVGLATHYDGYMPSKHGKKISLLKVRFLSFSWVKMHSIPYFMQNSINFLTPANAVELYIWEPELLNAKMFYDDLKFEVLETWQYDTRLYPFGEYFSENHAQRLEMERQGRHARALLYKKSNVAIYGKLIQKPKEEDYISTLDAFDVITTKAKKRSEVTTPRYSYPPAGSVTSMLSRVAITKLAYALGLENIAYIETDALFFRDCPKTREILKILPLGKNLNQWKLEEDITKSDFEGSKRYKYETKDGKITVRGSGLRINDNRNYDDIKLKNDSVEMIIKKKVKGGTLWTKTSKSF